MTYPTDRADYDEAEQEAVLSLIGARSEVVGGQAMSALRVPDPAARQLRMDKIVPQALGDASAEWTQSERARIAGAMVGTGAGEHRDDMIRVRVSAREREEIAARATEAGMDLSQYLRWRALS